MTRTGQQQARRRAIADAATGAPDAPSRAVSRVRVALYAITPGPQAINRLRDYARARDWLIIVVLQDAVPAETPLRERPMWPWLGQMITARLIDGIVTDDPSATPDDSHSHVFSALAP
ncbi:recombinase family protein [Streptomyces katsurahamanus]|uniref:Recombinase family protein n=1 Tax=Streptomyces katsurahamanus TaxID=2577098 RepID=A0ABW9NQ42_9ACTN|nr:hypothetical protein [Streptomyces katsurahamanus]MQS35422.1 hypothetical protein [Streptomyces katsurahamanus]